MHKRTGQEHWTADHPPDDQQSNVIYSEQSGERRTPVPQWTDTAEDGRYDEEPVQAGRSKRSWWLGALAVFGMLFGKFKVLLGPLLFVVKLLKLGKFFTTGFSMVIMIVSYTFLYGWKFAVGIVVLIFVHEMGHMYFAKLRKLDVSWPVFIPFLGAFIKMKEQPQDAATEAFVAVGGPFIGMLGAFVCLLVAMMDRSAFWAALAYFGFFITVFNMIPAHPLDGGRIAAALSPWMWVAGIAAMAVMTIYFFNPIALIILVLSIGKAWKVWRQRDEQLPSYYQVSRSFKFKMGLAYFGIFAVSSFFTYLLHEMLKG